MNRSKKMSLALAIPLLTALLLAACASGPRFDDKTFRPSPSPAEAAVDAALWQDSRVLWGGMILNSVNHEGGTEIEVLGYPLASGQRPDITRSPIGRFIVVKDGYLETVDYAEGRVVTITGTFTTTRDGRVGDARYVYPLVNADDIYLWSTQNADGRQDPQFSIGVGVLFGR